MQNNSKLFQVNLHELIFYRTLFFIAFISFPAFEIIYSIILPEHSLNFFSFGIPILCLIFFILTFVPYFRNYFYIAILIAVNLLTIFFIHNIIYFNNSLVMVFTTTLCMVILVNIFKSKIGTIIYLISMNIIAFIFIVLINQSQVPISV
jgi:hypothetical protein